MHSKYKVLKFSSNSFDDIEDLVSIEEPLEISLKFKEQDKWITQNLSITMRTPGSDEDLVRGFLFNEQIVQSIKDIESIENYGDKVGQYNIQNKILATLNNSQNVNISKIKRDFLINSSCGVCGKSSLDALEIIKKNKTNSSEPKITKETVIQSPKILQENQSEFSKTGGIHASGLFSSNGELVNLREDVGRHNAVDKIAGWMFLNKENANDKIFYTTGRLTSEMVIKTVQMGIPILISRSGFTESGVRLAKESGLTLIGRAKGKRMIIANGIERVVFDTDVQSVKSEDVVSAQRALIK